MLRTNSKLSTRIILCLLLVGLGILYSNASERVSYGEACNKTTKCDNRARLSCTEGYCGCFSPEQMVYANSSSSCVFKVGERCEHLVGKSGEGRHYHVFGCVENAYCDDDGICTCAIDFYEGTDGACEKTGGYYENCSSSVECSSSEGLVCIDNVCKCDDTRAEYEYDSSRCVGLAEGNCVNYRCTENASCDDNEDTCHCDHGFKLNSERKCVSKLDIMDACTEDSECEPKSGLELKCIDGFCKCNPKNAIYASVRRTRKREDSYYYVSSVYPRFEGVYFPAQCVPLPGHSCLNGLCAPRAYCEYDYDDDDDEGTCRCEPGNAESESGLCLLQYAEECKSPDECMDGLVCKNQECSCQFSNQVYSDSHESCHSLVGGPCGDDSSCGDNALCNLLPNLPGHCKCQPGYVVNENRECEVGYGGNCTSKSDCDSVLRLDCVNGACRCKEFAEYHQELRKCQGLVGTPCSFRGEDECVGYAFCKHLHPKLEGECTCKEGFKEAGNYTCIPSSESALVLEEHRDVEYI